MTTLKKYDHWCVRVHNLRGAITTASMSGATKREFLAMVGNDEELLRDEVKTAGAKCLKAPDGTTFSAQVRERVQQSLLNRARRLAARSKAGAPQVWPNDFRAEGTAQ